ncbi:hypothetical protein GCM10027430_16530 [Lysobacter tyrosinilyticus]
MLWYYVTPFAEGRWNIFFDGQNRPYSYDSANEALKAACKAAEVTRKQRQMATGVRVKLGGDWHDAVKFGH